MKFEELQKVLQRSWSEAPAAEPSPQWRSRLLRALREEKPRSLFDLFAESFPGFAMTAASCAVLIAGLTQATPFNRADSDDELLVQFFSGDAVDQSFESGSIFDGGNGLEAGNSEEVEVL